MRDVLRVCEVLPAAAVQMRLPPDTLSELFRPLTDPTTFASASVAARIIPFIYASQAPRLNSPCPEFFSATFATAAQIQCERTSWESHFSALRRYNRLATATLLRQLYAFGVNAPVFGVIFSKSLVAIHVDWALEVDGCMVSVVTRIMYIVLFTTSVGDGLRILRLR